MFYGPACFLYSNDACIFCTSLIGSSLLSSLQGSLHRFLLNVVPGILQILLASKSQGKSFQVHLFWWLTRTKQFSFLWLLGSPLCQNVMSGLNGVLSIHCHWPSGFSRVSPRKYEYCLSKNWIMKFCSASVLIVARWAPIPVQFFPLSAHVLLSLRGK